MIPVTQSRTGSTGTCFRSSLASILNLKENQVPDFKKANEDPEVNVWLAKRGLRYREVPATQSPPQGWHIICGVSPRGGYHAIVGFDGLEEWDPHPTWKDHTRAGLDKTIAWGILESLRKAKDTMDIRAMYEAAKTPMDISAATRAYNKLMDANQEPFGAGTMAALKKAAQERVAANNVHQSTGKEISTNMKMYTTARRPDLFRGGGRDTDPRKGVTKCQECGDKLLGDDVAEVHGKVVCPDCADAYHAKDTDSDELSHQAVQFMLEAIKAAKVGDTKKALERATIAEMKAWDAHDKMLADKAKQFIDKLKGTAKDADTRTFAEQLSAIRNAIQYIKMSLKTEKNAKQKAAYEKQLTEYTAKERDLARKVEAQNESEAWHEKASSKYFPSGFKGRSRVFDAAIDRYSMAQILNALGIDIKAYMSRNESQKRELLKTAIAKLKGAK